jgi:hypothetical protein
MSQRESSRFMRSLVCGASSASSNSASEKERTRRCGATAAKSSASAAASGLARSSSRSAGGRKGGEWACGRARARARADAQLYTGVGRNSKAAAPDVGFAAVREMAVAAAVFAARDIGDARGVLLPARSPFSGGVHNNFKLM